MNLYDFTIPTLLKMFANLEGWLAKAKTFSAEQDIPLEVLLNLRLFPNMFTLRQQVQYACSNATLLGWQLGDVTRPPVSRDELDFEQLLAVITETKAFLESVPRSGFEGADDRMVQIPQIKGMQLRGADLALENCVPNVFFHLTTAYAIMRSIGVPIGKVDYLGGLSLVPVTA